MNEIKSSSSVSSIPTAEDAKKAVKVTATFAKEQAKKLHKMATDGNASVKTFAFLCGLFMAITSIMGIWSNFFAFHLLSMIIHIYTFLFGILTCLLEGKEYALPTSYESMIEKYAMFLQYVWGRGCIYFFAGTLQFSQFKLLDIISGSCMAFVGIMYIIVGRSTAKKLLELRHSAYTEETIRKLFEEADTYKAGALSLELFTIFMERLGVEMKKNEIVTAFSLIDRDNSDKVTFDEFILWWNEFDSNTDSLSDAQWVV